MHQDAVAASKPASHSSLSKHMKTAGSWTTTNFKKADQWTSTNKKVVGSWTGAVYKGVKEQFKEQMSNPSKTPESQHQQPEGSNPPQVQSQRSDQQQTDPTALASPAPRSIPAQSGTWVQDTSEIHMARHYSDGGPPKSTATPYPGQPDLSPMAQPEYVEKGDPSHLSVDSSATGNLSSAPPSPTPLPNPPPYQPPPSQSLDRQPLSRKPIGSPAATQQPQPKRPLTQQSKDDSALLSATTSSSSLLPPSDLPPRPTTSSGLTTTSTSAKPSSVVYAERVGAGLGKATKATSAFIKTPAGKKVVIGTGAILFTVALGPAAVSGLGALSVMGAGMVADGLVSIANDGGGDGGVVDVGGSTPAAAAAAPEGDGASVVGGDADPVGGGTPVEQGTVGATDCSLGSSGDATALAGNQMAKNAYNGDAMDAIGGGGMADAAGSL
jgi:hypothetical protein